MKHIYMYINIRENRRGDHEWTIHKHVTRWVDKKQDIDKQNRDLKKKDEQHTPHKNRG